MKILEIQCSCCGERQKIELSRTGMLRNIENVIDKGWNSCGGVLYCPECTRTWADRNGDRPMGGRNNTFNIIWRMALRRCSMDEVSKVMFIDTGTEREVIICQKCKAKVGRKEERCPKCGRVLLWDRWEKSGDDD